MGHTHDAVVSGTILPELRKLRDIDQNATGPHLRAILKSRRALALVFHALNRAYGQDLFVAWSTEWEDDGPIDPVPGALVIDCHIHYFDGRPNWPHTHPAPQYQQGAHGSWWFFPEAYDFRGTIANWVSPVRVQPPHGLHTGASLRSHVFQTYDDLASQFRFFVTPAPHIGSFGIPLDGENDTASFSDMEATCARINENFKRTISVPFGVIRNYTKPTLYPSPTRNRASLWKVYPTRGYWNDPNAPSNPATMDAFFKSLPEALNTLRGEHTLCIHWWDDREAASERNLGAVADAFPNIRFVIYHSCYPNFAQFRGMLARPNVYAEIGGVFANMVLGGDGRDGITPPPIHGGPVAARRMIETLRGTVRGGRGEYDDKIVWGTDAIWHGSPFWQVEAFKRLKLTSQHQTPEEITFKRKVLGRNAEQAFPVAYSLVA